jgi:hypothetical protein
MLTAFAEFYQIQVIPVIGFLPRLLLTLTLHRRPLQPRVPHHHFHCLVPRGHQFDQPLARDDGHGVNAVRLRFVALRYQRFASPQLAPEILSPEQLKEGRRQLDRHKRLMERATRRASLKEKIGLNLGGIAKLTPRAVEGVAKSWFGSLWKKESGDTAPSFWLIDPPSL